jgi:putative tricarboxylic transport membrane protein
MKRFAWPRPAMLIGFVLAPQAETYLYQALQFYDWAFLTRPGVIIIGLMALASVIFGLRNRVDDTGHVVAASDDTNEHEGRWTSRTPQIVFAAVMIGLLVMGLKDALDQSFLAAVFPASVAVVGLAMALWLVPELIVGRRGHAAHYDSELDGEHVGKSGVGGLWDGALWIGGLVLTSALIGFYLAMILFFIAFLQIRARATVLQTAIMTVAAAAFILLIAKMLSLNFPSGVLQSYLDLPWPFR